MVQDNILINDRTFFIMRGGDVKTYYNTKFTSHGIDILVYDRDSQWGYGVLDITQVQDVVVEYSKEYNDKLKAFILILHQELENDPLLHQYVCGIWNQDIEMSDEAYWEDVCLPQQFENFMDKLLERNIFDESIVRYFRERYCYQELVYPKYSLEWLKSHCLR